MDTKGAGTSRSILAVIGGLLGVLVGAALIWGAATVLLDARDADGFYITDAYAFEGSSRVTVFDDVERLAEVPAGLVDRIAWFRAPGVMGGDGIPTAAPFGVDRLADMPRFAREAVLETGADLLEIYGRAP